MINVTIEKDKDNFDLTTMRIQYKVSDILKSSETILMNEVIKRVAEELSKDVTTQMRKVITKDKLVEIITEAVKKELSNG